MTGLDTNVLVRYLVQDDPAQALAASALIEETAASAGRLLIQPVVLCELVWVLETAYGLARNDIAGILDRILRTGQFEIPGKEAVWRAWTDYRSGRGDFADYLIGRANEAHGATVTVTFDRTLRGHRAFRLLQT